MTDLHRAGAVALAVLLVLSGAGVGAVHAQTDDTDDSDDDSLMDRLIDVGPAGILSGLWNGASGTAERVQAQYLGDEVSPEQCRDDLVAELRDEKDVYLDAVNNRTTASTTRDVVEVRCVETTDEETTSASLYLVADVNSTTGDYENFAVTTSTSREIDHTVELSGVARKEFAGDLETFADDYLKTGEQPGPGYKARMYQKYKGSVAGTFEFLPPIEDGDG